MSCSFHEDKGATQPAFGYYKSRGCLDTAIELMGAGLERSLLAACPLNREPYAPDMSSLKEIESTVASRSQEIIANELAMVLLRALSVTPGPQRGSKLRLPP